MLYKAFAVITLVAAPLIVLMVQGLAPHVPAQNMSAPMRPVVEQAVPSPQPIATPDAEQPASSPMSFGQPMPEDRFLSLLRQRAGANSKMPAEAATA